MADDLANFVGEKVLVKMMNGNQITGVLDSYNDDSTVTITGDGGPSPSDDDFVSGDLQYDFVDGSRIVNWQNVESVELWDRPYVD